MNNTRSPARRTIMANSRHAAGQQSPDVGLGFQIGPGGRPGRRELRGHSEDLRTLVAGLRIAGATQLADLPSPQQLARVLSSLPTTRLSIYFPLRTYSVAFCPVLLALSDPVLFVKPSRCRKPKNATSSTTTVSVSPATCLDIATSPMPKMTGFHCRPRSADRARYAAAGRERDILKQETLADLRPRLPKQPQSIVRPHLRIVRYPQRTYRIGPRQ